MNSRRALSAADLQWATPIAAPMFAYTEAGAAEHFCHDRGDRVRYDHRRKRWLTWSGHRWAPDSDGAIVREILDFVRTQQHASVELRDTFEKSRALDHWSKFDRLQNLTNLQTIARHLPPVSDAGDNWDRDPLLLGTPNGVIDLRTGHLRAGTQADRITRNVAVAFDPDAPCPLWERFMGEVFDGDGDLVDFVHRALGYSATGLTGEQVAMLGHGCGSNGKGVLGRTVRRVLADYASTMPFSTIEADGRSSVPNDLAALDGPRFVIASETSDGTRINESRFKSLTGSDPLSARYLHQEFFEFQPQCKLWLFCNHLPVVRDDSHSFWRRVRQIPFTRTFAVDDSFEDRIWAEAPGVLAWIVRGCLLWQADGLRAPERVVLATNAYREDSDVLAGFLAEACVLVPTAQIAASDLFQHYVVWASKSGLTERERLSSTAFGRKMAERFERRHTRFGRAFIGVGRADA